MNEFLNPTLRWQAHGARLLRLRRASVAFLASARLSKPDALTEQYCAEIHAIDRDLMAMALCLNPRQVAAFDAERAAQDDRLRDAFAAAAQPLRTLQADDLRHDPTGQSIRALHGPVTRRLNATMPADIADPRDRATACAQVREMVAHATYWLRAAERPIAPAEDPVAAVAQVESWLVTGTVPRNSEGALS